MEYIKRFLNHSQTKQLNNIFFVFVLWRIFLLFCVIFAIYYFPLYSRNYLGGGYEEYVNSPFFWSWANFDGEHYVSIARFGYKPLTYFFFPLYPISIGILVNLVGGTGLSPYLYSGIAISHILFFVSLVGIYKLALLDYEKKIALRMLMLVLVFPTAFYFVSVYSESLFLALTVWSFYFARKKNWLLAAVLAGLASATRLVGIVIFPALVLEFFSQYKKLTSQTLILIISPIGLLLYSLYLQLTKGDFLAFFHSVEIFGEQRSANLVILPQVFYRYIFKILPVVTLSWWPSFIISWAEFLSAVILVAASVFSFFKIRASYTIYLIGGFLIPAFSGSFSSLPRYVLVLFPLFLVISLWMEKTPRYIQYLVFVVLVALQFLFVSLFSRGYWVS